MQCARLGTLVLWPLLGGVVAAAWEPAGRGERQGQRLWVQVQWNCGGPVDRMGPELLQMSAASLVLRASGPSLRPPCFCSFLLPLTPSPAPGALGVGCGTAAGV